MLCAVQKEFVRVFPPVGGKKTRFRETGGVRHNGQNEFVPSGVTKQGNRHPANLGGGAIDFGGKPGAKKSGSKVNNRRGGEKTKNSQAR